MPLTDVQRNAVSIMRAMFKQASMFTYGTIESFEQRARQPAPGTLPPDVTVRIEIAPPSPNPDPILAGTGALKTPERVPMYFYSLNSGEASANSDSDPDAQDSKSEDILNTRVIFYMHGGGNVVGHPTQDFFMQYYGDLLRAVASQSGSKSTCVLIAPSYRLATGPENAFPAALQDILAAYDYVLSKGYKPSNIIVAGDSAGGNHAIVMTHLVLQSGKPCPNGVIAIAPSSKLRVPDSTNDQAKERDIIDQSTGDQMTKAYIGGSGVSPIDPLISGSLLSFSVDWPRTLILVGDADGLIDASRELKTRIAALGRPVELVEYEQRPHGWWCMPQVFPENVQDSAERIARFVLQ